MGGSADAKAVKVQQNQLAATLKQLDRLYQYASLQTRCQILEGGKEDLRHSGMTTLRKTID
jgi:hypothetical protein